MAITDERMQALCRAAKDYRHGLETLQRAIIEAVTNVARGSAQAQETLEYLKMLAEDPFRGLRDPVNSALTIDREAAHFLNQRGHIAAQRRYRRKLKKEKLHGVSDEQRLRANVGARHPSYREVKRDEETKFAEELAKIEAELHEQEEDAVAKALRDPDFRAQAPAAQPVNPFEEDDAAIPEVGAFGDGDQES
jgi:hypothetical protein